jgi:hypothetical protein
MKKRLVIFLEDNKVLTNVQFGFRKNKSTTMAVLNILQKIYTALENKQIPCCLFLDFAKAFDTVDHKILLSKLKHYGIRGVANNWFKSYLSNRQQSVRIGSVLSDKEIIAYGVPQGSVLGPILFLLFINDISSGAESGDPTLFADDSSLFYSSNDRNKLEKIINKDLDKISKWLISNKLSLNVSKSNFIIFGKSKNISLSISLNGVSLLQKDCVKYLGIYLDSKLSWKNHIDHVKKKLSSSISVIYNLRSFVTPVILKQIYYSFIYSNILYGIEVWGAANKTSLLGVSKLMNKSIRALSFKRKCDNVKPLYDNNNFLSLNNIIKLSWGCMIKKCLLGHHSMEFEENVFKKQNHRFVTRSKECNLVLPFFTLQSTRNSIFFSGIISWNQNKVGEIHEMSLNAFKNNLKKFLLNNQSQNQSVY